MYAQISSICLLAFSAAISTTSAGPTIVKSRAPVGISANTYPDAKCTVLASGYPTFLDDGACINVPGGIESLEFPQASSSSTGTVTLYADADCCADGDSVTFSPEELGCIATSLNGTSIKYNA